MEDALWFFHIFVYPWLDYLIFLRFTSPPLIGIDLPLYLIDAGSENEGRWADFPFPPASPGASKPLLPFFFPFFPYLQALCLTLPWAGCREPPASWCGCQVGGGGSRGWCRRGLPWILSLRHQGGCVSGSVGGVLGWWKNQAAPEAKWRAEDPGGSFQHICVHTSGREVRVQPCVTKGSEIYPQKNSMPK